VYDKKGSKILPFFIIKSYIINLKIKAMKKLITLISVLTCVLQFSFAQKYADTIKAKEYYSKGKELYNSMSFDSAFVFFQKASDIYLKNKLWDNYFYSEAEKSNCKNLNYDFDSAFEIINKSIEFSKNKIPENNAANAYLIFIKGKIFHNMNMPDSALGYYEKALNIRQKIYKTENRELADSYYYLNKIYFSFGDLKNALFYNDKALKIAKNIYDKDNSFIINILNDKGLIELYSMNHRNAEKIFNHTLNLTRKKFGLNSIENIYPLSYLGLVYQDLGDYDNAIENQKEVLRLAITNLGNEHYYCGTAYQNLANAYNHNLENDIAVEYALKAIDIFKNVFGEKSKDVADAEGNLGVIYSDMQDFDNAKKYFLKSLKLFKEIKGEKSYDVSRIYQSIAAMYQESGDYENAEKYNQIALDIKKELVDKNHYSLGMMYMNMAVNETYLRKYEEAIRLFDKAEPIIAANYGKKSVNSVILYNDLGDTYKFKGDITKSLVYYQKAITLNHQSFHDTVNFFSIPPSEGFYSWSDYYNSILAKAEIFASFSDKFKTLSKIQCNKAALKLYMVCDTVLSRIKRTAASKEDKLLLASKTVNLYKGMVSTCLKLSDLSTLNKEKSKYSELAFFYSEKNKASVLLEALAGIEAQKFAGIPDSLLNQEKNIKVDISYYKKLIAESSDSIELSDYFNKLFDLNRTYDSLISIFENKYPKYHNLKYAGFQRNVSDIQKRIGKNTGLLSYFLADSSLVIYFMSQKKYLIKTIPVSKTYSDLIKRFRLNISDASLLQDAYISNNNRIVKEYIEDANELYRLLFPDEIKKILKKALFSPVKNLIIIPDGELSTIPFEALLTQKYTADWTDWNNTAYFSEMPYLVKNYNISYSYSANLFYETNPKTKDKPEFQDINDWLALAPVFDNDSIAGTSLRTRQLIEKNSVDKTGKMNTRAWLRNGTYISPLPGSEKETENIFKIFEENNKKAVLKTRKYANEEFIKSGALKNYRFLHIATHGMVNEDKPELSCILLAQDTTSTEDNILYSGEIYNLELNADLTVLSACETGLGKIAEGEGVIGLTRALLYAGSKNIIVSLWQVSDESTNQLMVDFYENIFKDKSDYFAQHLSKAKLKLINEGKYAHPFFWSPFVLIGK